MGASSLSSRSIIGTFFATLQAALGTSWVNAISWLNDGSNQESETYGWLGMAPAMREMLGGIQPRGLRASAYSITNKEFEASIEVLVSELRRDKTGQIKVRISELAKRCVEHWAKLLSDLIVAGETGVCYDGDYFFGTAHSEGASGTQINLLTASQVAALNVTTAASPTAAEMAQAILGVISYMQGYKDDQGEPMNTGAKNWLVLCPKGDIYAAAIQAVANATINASTNILANSDQFKISVECNPRTTATTTFEVFNTDGEVKPLIRQEEVPLMLQAIAEGSEEEIRNSRHIYVAKATRNVGYGYWQKASRSTLS